MNKLFITLFGSGLCLIHSIEANPSSPVTSSSTTTSSPKNQEEGIVLFTPPAGWHLAEASALPANVRVMVVGKGPSSFPPSLNLSSEPYKGTLKQYLKIVKNMNDAQGYEWKDLGNIQTQAGTGNLSQVDTKTQWGNVRLMHVILVKNGRVYILTASALKDEFSIFYKDFFAAMRSLRIAQDAYEMVSDSQQRSQLKSAADKLQTQWKTLLAQKQKENSQMKLSELQQTVFNSEEFQNTIWNPFKEMLKQKYQPLGEEWRTLFLQKLENQLLIEANNYP
jgi:hypothetical protein